MQDRLCGLLVFVWKRPCREGLVEKVTGAAHVQYFSGTGTGIETVCLTLIWGLGLAHGSPGPLCAPSLPVLSVLNGLGTNQATLWCAPAMSP